jgi:3-deoxy-D-manno-octulosonic-acid transferase
LLDSVYLGLLACTVPYLWIRGKGRQVRDHIPRRFRDIPARPGGKPCLWVHGVSVGELLSVRKLLARFGQEFPGWEVVLSTTTRSGLDAARVHYPTAPVISYPFDFSYLVKRAFDRIRPDLILIVEHELWPNFLWQAQARHVPVAMVNARLSERSLRGYRWLSRVDTWPPPGIVAICTQDEVSAAAFRRLGVAEESIRVTGNLKFDNVPALQDGIREELGLNGAEWVLVAASTHRGEEDALLESFAALRGEDARSRLIIAPRRIERAGELARLIEERGFRSLRWSALAREAGGNGGASHDGNGNGSPADARWNGQGEVLLVDTVGDLDRLQAAGDVVFVGGSLVPFGGHNVIAPAGIGRPVVIGPHYQNFRHAVSLLLEREALLVAEDARDLAAKLRELKRDPRRAGGMGRRAVEAVADHAGASERTLEVLRPLIESSASCS